MASLGSLVVSLALDTARFSGDVGKAAQQMARLTAEAGKVGAAIGASIGAGIKVLGDLVTSSVNAADRTGELAEMVGITAEEMSRLGYAAQLSATDQETLATSMTKLAKLSADAAAGGASATAVFDSMGISVKAADGSLRSTTDVLGDIADKFASYREGTAKAALATEIFGKNGAQLIPFLNRGRDGLQELAAEADMLGITLSGTAANAAGEFNDRLDQLAAAKRGLGLQIAQQLLPTINTLTAQLFEGAKNTDLFGRVATIAATGVKLLISSGAILVGVFQTLGQAVGGVVAAIVALVQGRFTDAWNIAKSTVIDFGANVRGTAETVASVWASSTGKVAADAAGLAGKIEAPIVRSAAAAKKGADEVAKAADAYLRLSQGVGQAVASAMAEVDVTQQLTPLQQLQIKLQDELTTGKHKFNAAQRNSIEAQIAWIGTLDREISATKQLQQMARERADARNADYQAAEDAARANQQADRDRLRGMLENTPTGRTEIALRQIDFINRKLEQGAIDVEQWAELARQTTGNLASETMQASDAARDLGMTFQSAFEDAVIGGQNLRDIIGALDKDVARILLRRWVTQPAAEGITGWADKLLQGMGTGSGSAPSGGSGSWFSGMLSAIGNLFAGSGANGMYIPPGRWGWVGENGPEPAFGGSTGLQVQPAGAGGGAVYHIHVSATPGMTRGVAMQQGAQIGLGLQRAMARNS